MKNFFTSFKHFMSFWENITKCQRPINNTCSEYSDGLKLIKEYRPKYNTMLRDDKTYPYIKVTLGEEFPRVLFCRQLKKDENIGPS